MTESGTSALSLEQHCRGSVNTAELGLFSPEITETTTITNFPIPDPWSTAEVGGVNAEGLFPVNCVLGQEQSEDNPSLFDPSKMIIAKVESLSEDSRFNEYLNQILESEEVMECLNSINTTTTSLSLVDPPQIQLVAQEEPPASSQLGTPPAVGNILSDGCVPPASTSTAACDTTSPPSSSTLTDALVHPCAETVAAYIAAETNIVPLAATSCLMTTDVDSASGTCQTDPEQVGLLEVEVHGGTGDSLQPSVSTSSHPKPDNSVMWSQTGMNADAGSETQTSSQQQVQQVGQEVGQEVEQQQVQQVGQEVEQQQVQQQQQPKTVCASSISDSVECDSEVKPPPPSPVTAPSSREANIEKHQEKPKRRIIRVKRQGKMADVSSIGTGKSECSHSEVKMHSPAKSTTTAPEPPTQPPKVKSRNGRLLKPSWKVVQATTNDSTKSTTSLSASALILSKDCSDHARVSSSRAERDGPLQHSKSIHKSQKMKVGPGVKSTATVSSLSLPAAVARAGLKKLPDIPATPCSPKSTVSFPSTSGGFSMSLDDILRQMNDEEPQKEQSLALEFAESLLANVPPRASTQVDEDTQEKKEEDVAMVVVEAKDDEKSSDRRLCVELVEQSSVMKSASALSVEDSTGRGSTTRNSVSGFVSSIVSQTPQQTAMPEQQATVRQDHLTTLAERITEPSKQESFITDVSDEIQMQCNEATVKQVEGDDCCSTVSMDVCDSESSQERVRSSPVYKRQGQVELKESLCETKGDDCKDKGEDEIEIFADDVDVFTIYTMEEAKKNATPPRMPSPPSECGPLFMCRDVYSCCGSYVHISLAMCV